MIIEMVTSLRCISSGIILERKVWGECFGKAEVGREDNIRKCKKSWINVLTSKVLFPLELQEIAFKKVIKDNIELSTKFLSSYWKHFQYSDTEIWDDF